MLVVLWTLLACKPGEPDRPVVTAAPEQPSGSTGAETTTDTGEDTTPPSLSVRVGTHVALPFVTVGEPVPSGELGVEEIGGAPSEGGLTWTVDGSFSLVGDDGALSAGETRALTVSYTGAVDAPIIATGAARLSVDDWSETIDLAAVVGDQGLSVVDWTEDDYGLRAVVELPSAPFPHSSGSYTDSSVLVFLPHHLTDQGDLGVVTHIHGHGAVLTETVAAQYLVEQHALSGRDAALVIPQGPVDASDGNFGRLDEAGGHAALVRDAVSTLYRDGLIERPALGEQVVSAHSGGYLCAAWILTHGGLGVSAVHLLDALYGQSSTYESYALGGGLLRSIYTDSGGTSSNNQSLARALSAAGLPVGDELDDAALAADTLTIARTDDGHSGHVYSERNAARLLTHSGLRRSPLAPPELMAVTSDGETATVTWRPDGAETEWAVQGSADGETWTTLATTADTRIEISALAQVRVSAVSDAWGEGAPSDAYPGSGADWLVVDGFDRVLGGSYAAFTHDFGARIGAAIGAGASGASNEAIIEGRVDLADYSNVLWLLGDESTADTPLTEAEMTAIEDHVASGGRLIISGSELGFAGDTGWISDVLHADYVADDAGTDSAGGYTFGVIYPEDYPDVWSGDETIWTYETGGAAAVAWDDRVVVVGFALETLPDAQLADALFDLTGS